MKKFVDYLACDDVDKITDITDQFNYEDLSNKHKVKDRQLVSCGQDGLYNELEYIYEHHLSVYVLDGDITKEQAIKGLCVVCHSFDSGARDREEFYKKLSEVLGVQVPYPDA